MSATGPADARSWVELDLEAIRTNARTILRTAGVPLLAVVKANGYGHGAGAVATAAIEGGASRVGVATAAEALALRQEGLQSPIQVLGSFLRAEVDTLIAANTQLTLHEPEDLERARRVAWKCRRRIGVHVKVDVGMSRHGVGLKDAMRMLALAHRDPCLRLEGLMTHLPCATSEDPSATRGRIRLFGRLVDWADAAGFLPPQVHAAASVALFRFPEARFGQVRSGIALVGLDPAGRIAASGTQLEPALSIRARVMRLKTVQQGTPVGYGSRWVAPRQSRLAILGIGYADGLPYGLTGHDPQVLIQGRRCPLVGSVMMDYVVADVTQLPRPPAPGDVATLVGTDGTGRIPLEEQARKAGIIPYALTCGLGTRIRRVVTETPKTLRLLPRHAA